MATTIALDSSRIIGDGPVEDLRRTSIDAVAEGALSERWQPAIEPSDGGTLTIVFSDIESSTEMATRLGDRGWFVTFPSARRAVLFAVATQRALEASRQGGSGIRIRMGLHTGEAIIDRSGDLFGRHVIVAARVANLASGGEILVSSLVREIVAARGDIILGPPREVTLKGIEGTHLVYPIEHVEPNEQR